jgi:uncharacterized protein (DUF1800 family)
MRGSCVGAALLLVILGVVAPAASESPRLDFRDARHLLARTGFMPRADEIAAFEGLSREDAVRRLLDGARLVARTPAPPWADEAELPRSPGRMASEDERRAARRALREKTEELVAWWYREMALTDSPLTERMTLFWHNHFTSAYAKVRLPHLLYRQNATLRRHALGNFRQFVHAVAADPAMIVYLDGARSRRGEPNENFARELLELFTLGEGRYTEQDIKEAARAFTGWSLDRDSGRFVFRRALHDDGPKTFLGRAGSFNGTDIIDIVLDKPEVAAHIAGKAWREFVSETPDQAEIARIAAKFGASGYEIKVLMREILLVPQFWAAANRGRLVQSPAELIAGSIRAFGLEVPPGATLIGVGRALGQEILNPPNVKGWAGGTSWITANTLLTREQLMRRLVDRRASDARPPAPADDDMMRGRDSDDVPAAPRRRFGNGPRLSLDGGRPGTAFAGWYEALPGRFKSADILVALLLPTWPGDAIAGSTASLELARRLVLDPAFQLK